jgi:transposase-like protein
LPSLRSVASAMTEINYAGYRFPPEIIHQSIWLYLRFTLSFRDVEDLLGNAGLRSRTKRFDAGSIISGR